MSNLVYQTAVTFYKYDFTETALKVSWLSCLKYFLSNFFHFMC